MSTQRAKDIENRLLTGLAPMAGGAMLFGQLAAWATAPPWLVSISTFAGMVLGVWVAFCADRTRQQRKQSGAGQNSQEEKKS